MRDSSLGPLLAVFYGCGFLAGFNENLVNMALVAIMGDFAVDAVAAQRTEVLFLNIGKVLTTCTNACPFHAKLIQNLLTVCAAKNLQLSQRILHTTPKGIRARLMSYFSECVKRAGQYSFDIPYNRQQLADYLGVDRSAMCSELSRMQREGLLTYHKNHFSVHEALE